MEVMKAMEAMDLQENDEELAMLEAIEESRMMAGMKPCDTCKTWTRSPIRSPTYKDCPHSACSLRCLTAMEKNFVTRKLEILKSAVSSSSNANDAQRNTTAGGSVEELLQSGEAWHEE